MSIRICKSLIFHSVKNPVCLHKPHGSLRCLFVLFFSSSSSKEKPKKNLKNPIFDLLVKHKISSETASKKIASKLSHLKSTEKCDSILSFLKESGFSITHLERIVEKYPAVLALKLDITVKPKIKIFQDLGFSTADIADIFSADPWVFQRSAKCQIQTSILVLRNLLGSTTEVAKVLKKPGFGIYLKCDLEKTMVPNIEILKSFGISSCRILRNIYSFPRFLMHRPQNMEDYVKKVHKMGCVTNSVMFLHALRTVSSISPKQWELKCDAFRNLGFSEDKILSIFQRKPHAFGVSSRKIKEVAQVLLDTGRYNMEDVFDQPEVVTLSVEKRLKPRLHVLEILTNRNLIKKFPSLSSMCKSSNQKFFEKFIFPYSHEVCELNLPCEGVWAEEISKSADSVGERTT